MMQLYNKGRKLEQKRLWSKPKVIVTNLSRMCHEPNMAGMVLSKTFDFGKHLTDILGLSPIINRFCNVRNFKYRHPTHNVQAE